MTKTKVILQGATQTGDPTKDDWCTPTYILDRVSKFYKPQQWFDPFPYNATFNTFDYEWPERVYCNPPFSQYLDCALYGVYQLEKNSKEQIWICHHNHDTRWFKVLREHASVMCMLNQRVKFLDPITFEPKSTAIGKCQTLFYIGNRREEFIKAFKDIGYCVYLEM